MMTERNVERWLEGQATVNEQLSSVMLDLVRALERANARIDALNERVSEMEGLP